jgi:hypothetical protein
MASPLVAGVAALVRASSPSLTADQVKDRIRETAARPTPEQIIKRRLDAANAVTAFAAPGNPNDDTRNFVRQNYLDFFNRAPDASGFDFWSNQISGCGASAACIQFKRVNTSGAFFLSIEFKDTGYFVYRLNKAAFGNLAGKPVTVRYEEFMPDTQKIGEGLIVNSPGWEERMASNRAAFLDEWVNRAAFKAEYPEAMTSEQYVTKLFAQGGVVPTTEEKNALVAGLNDGTETRASVLRKVAEHPALTAQEKNRAFVLMQYFGYMRRDPDDIGFNFWLTKLLNHGGDYISAEMVNSFLVSSEYKQRFGPQ